MTSDVKFEFIGFSPDEKIRNFVSTVAEKIHFSAPSDATMNFVVEKSKNAIRASCRIASRAGTFVAEAMSDNPVRAIQQIESRIKAQLDGWKKYRFEKGIEEARLSQDTI